MQSDPIKLKSTQITPTRARLLAEQGGKCALCCLPLTAASAVLDHDHDTGAIRGVLHRSCNAVLGKTENGAVRYCVPNLVAFASGLGNYIRTHQVNVTGLIHPLHRTPEEKKLLRNKRARIKRAKTKETT